VACPLSFAAWLRIAVSILPACGHAIPTDCVSVELQRQFDVAAAKQGLHGSRIGSGADEK